MLLETADTHKRFKHVQVLRGADSRIAQGEVIGLVSENGSGKSTLLRIIVGLLPQPLDHMPYRCSPIPLRRVEQW